MELLMGLIVLGTSLAVALVLPVVSFVRASRAAREAQRLALELAALRREVEALRGTQVDAKGPPQAPAPAAARQPPDAAWHATVQALHHAQTDATPQEVAPTSAEHTGAAGAEAAAPPPLAVPPAPAEQRPVETAATLEQRIGARWLLYAGMAALILGLSYFVKFAFDNGWVSEPLRVAVGLATGVALIVAGLRFSRRGLLLFGHVLAGGGVVALYVAIYAALHTYGLIGAGTAFVAMVLVTGLSAALANRERSQALAMLALAGGFATPALIGGSGSQLVLFTYVALLVTGAATLALRHAWPAVHLVAYVLTVLTVSVWALTSYTPTAWLRTELFLTLYVVLFVTVLMALRRRPEHDLTSRAVAAVLMSAPFLYHVASISVLASHPGALLVYFVLSTVAGLSVTHHANAPWLRSAVLLLVALPLMAWMNGLRRPGWYPGAIITACAVYVLHLAGQWRAVSDDDAPAQTPVAEVVHTHLNGLFLPAALYTFLDTRAAWWNPPMLTGLALWNAAIAAVTMGRTAVLPWQFAAVAATLTAVAIGVWFDGPAVAVGWAMEAAALARFALVQRSAWIGAGSAALFVVAALRLIDMLGEPLAVSSWPIVNTRTLAVAMVVGAAAWVARLLRQDAQAESPARTLLILGSHVLAIGWLSAEIHAVFGTRAYEASASGYPVGVARAELFEQVALSVSWALYAVGLIGAGMLRRYPPVRYLGIALFGLTILKVLLRDIAELDRVYQMLSVLGVGALLLLASYLYQRMAAAAPAPAPSTDGTVWDPPTSTDVPPPADGAAEPLD